MILVTGANSLLGTNTVIELLERGHLVRSLVRRSNSVLEQTEIFRGDVSSAEDLSKAMEGCRAVVHIAAITAQELLKLDDYRFNWECASLVARTAKEMGLERMIFVSSANTVGNGTSQKPAREDESLKKPYSNSLYAQSKVIAEKLVLEQFPQAVIINPGFMLGAYDSKPSSGEIIIRAMGRSIVVAPTGGKSFIHVRDVATAIVNAMTATHSGQKYLASGTEMSIRDFYKLMRNVTGQKLRIITIPSWIIILVGYVGDLLRFCRVKTPLSSVNMHILCQREYYDNSKIREELTMPQTPIRQAIKDAIEWFADNKTGNI